MVQWLVVEAKIPVDGIDIAGTTALMYAISTKPYLEIGFAEILLAGGADINKINR